MSYSVVAMYDGFSHQVDEKIERAARCKSDGSGFGFGVRDMSFTFATKRGASGAVKRILKLGMGIRAWSAEQED